MALEQPRKYFDVARPGSSAPPATSRPVIAAKSPLTKDPMFHESLKPPLAIPAAPPKKAQKPKQLPEAEVAALDPTALLIQSGDYVPLKPSGAAGKRAVVIVMIILLVVLSAASYLMVLSL